MPDLPTEAEVAQIREDERECLEAVARGEIVSCPTVRLLALVEAWAPIVEDASNTPVNGWFNGNLRAEWARWKGEA